jgi:hypothetical protein
MHDGREAGRRGRTCCCMIMTRRNLAIARFPKAPRSWLEQELVEWAFKLRCHGGGAWQVAGEGYRQTNMHGKRARRLSPDFGDSEQGSNYNPTDNKSDEP